MRRAAMLAGVLMLTACSSSAREAQPYEGTWVSDGFGIYLAVRGGNADIYEHSSTHCAHVYGGTARGISDVLAVEGNRLILTDSGRVIHLDPIDALPPACAQDYRTDDAARVVAVAAATMEELYRPALDDEWAARRTMVEEGLSDTSDRMATFRALTILLGPLGDPGVRLAPDDPAVWDGVWSSASGPFSGGEPYVPSGLDGVVVSGDDGIVTGAFGGTGYIGLGRLGGFAGDDEGSQRVLAAELDGVLGTSESVILDLRAASSGRAVEAMLVASRFVPDERLVATQMTGATAAGEVTVTPTVTGPYPGKVVVLIGPGTAGSAEMLVLAIRDLRGVSLLGEATAGSPNPPLARTLPNGWMLGVPSLDLVTPDGRSWTGVPIDPVTVVPTTSADLDAHTDPGVAAALALLG